MKIISRIRDILEYVDENNNYIFPIKGHDLNDDDVRIFIDSELYSEGEALQVDKILNKKEIAYSTSRFCDGQEAKDEGFSCYLNFYETYKKGLGKCTNYIVTLEAFEDN